MSKKNKYKDFWGVSAEDQMEDQEMFDEMEERGEIDIFSLGKIKKHYTGIEPEITADINRVFGNKVDNGDTYKVPEDSFNARVTESESFVSSLKEDTDKSNDIHFDPTVWNESKTTKNNTFNKSSNSNDISSKVNKNNVPKNSYRNSGICPIRFNYFAPILSLTDNVVSLYYKIGSGENTVRYIRDDIIYDDSALREIMYLVRDIVAFRYPTALYKFNEFDQVFDQIKGNFISAAHESKYMFIDFDNYVAAYYFGERNLMDQLSKFKVAKTNREVADIIMGLAVESLDFNLAFTEEEFERYYNSDKNNANKKNIIELIKNDIEVGDDILMLDVHSFEYLFDKSEDIINRYSRSDFDYVKPEFNNDNDEDNDLENEIKELLDDIPDEPDDDEIDYDSDIEDDDFENSEELDDEDDTNSDADTSDNTENDIDQMIDEAVGEDEQVDKPMPIDKVAINNPNKDDKSMVVEVTRKTHN